MKEFLKKVWKWVGTDGLLHITCSTLLYLWACPIMRWWGAILFALAFGIGKELYDRCHPDTHDASWHDVECDLIGIGLGLLYLGWVWVWSLIF